MTNYVGQQLGNYRLIRLLGQGGFAVVYLGEHVRLGMKAAVKVLHAHLAGDEIRAFQQEAQIISALKHPHIIRILDFDVQAGTPFLVLDYAPSGSLRQKHPRGIRLPSPLVIDYVMQIADALQYAHNQRLIHRDIKPENMLIGDQGEILLSDFGIATIAHSTSSMNTQSSMGTLAYMPPEQIQGKPRKESDQYALAVTAYQWLTGELPFQGSSTEMVAQHLAVPAPPLRDKVPQVPVALEQVVLKALAKDPGQRYGQIQGFAQACHQALVGQHPVELASSGRAQHSADVTPTRPAMPTRDHEREGDWQGRLLNQTSGVPTVTPQYQVPSPWPLPPPSTSTSPALDHSQNRTDTLLTARSKKRGLGVALALTLVFLIVGVWLVIALAMPPSYQTLTQQPPTNAYTLQDEQSKHVWPATGVDGCAFVSGGYQVSGAGSTNQLRKCGGYVGQPTENVLVQITVIIQAGQCGGFEMSTGEIEICSDGTYKSIDAGDGTYSSIDTGAQDAPSSLHRGVNTTNIVAFSVTHDGETYTQTTYINGQDVIQQNYTNPTDDQFSPERKQNPGYLVFVSDNQSSILFKDVKIWNVNTPSSGLYPGLLAGDAGSIIVIWIVWIEWKRPRVRSFQL